MAPEIFGWQHFTYLAVFIILAITSYILILKFVKDEKILNIIIKCVAGALLLAVCWNRICIVLKNNDPIYLIPDSICGTSSFILSISVLVSKRNAGVLHYISYAAFIGGLATIIYPDFIGQDISFFYPATISGLLHHTLMVYLVVLMLLTKWFVPTLKKWYYFPLGVCCVTTYGVFLLTALKINNPLNLTGPILEGTILTWWFVALVSMLVALTVMVTFDYFNVWKKKKLNNNKVNNNEIKEN